MRKSVNTAEKLDRALIKNYELRDPWEVACGFESHIMDMFRVSEVVEGGVRLVHFFDDREFEVRIFERDVLENMKRGGVFLMAIILVSGKWQLWYSSTAYG
jgi:hypothetical protein